MGGLCVKHVTCTHMTVLQLAAFSEFRHDRSTSLQSHSHVHSISESLDIYLFVHTAQPVLDVATFQRFSEWRRHKDAIFSQAMDGLSQGRLLHAVDLSVPPPPKHWWALLYFWTLLHIVVFLLLVLDVTRAPLVGNAPEALLQFSYEAHPDPLFSDAD